MTEQLSLFEPTPPPRLDDDPAGWVALGELAYGTYAVYTDYTAHGQSVDATEHIILIVGPDPKSRNRREVRFFGGLRDREHTYFNIALPVTPYKDRHPKAVCCHGEFILETCAECDASIGKIR